MQEAKTRIAVYEKPVTADAAVRRLLARGIHHDRIQVVCSEELPDIPEAVETNDGADDRAVTPAVVGGAVGSVLGGAGAAIGMAAAGAGLVAAGPILGGAAAMGVTGGLLSAMAARGTTPEVVDYYDQALSNGEVLVAVAPSEDSSQPDQRTVHSVLAHGAAEVSELG